MTWKSAKIYFSVFYILITILKCMVSVSVSHHVLLCPSLQLGPGISHMTQITCSSPFPENYTHLAGPTPFSLAT